jgi:hypothetical protein
MILYVKLILIQIVLVIEDWGSRYGNAWQVFPALTSPPPFSFSQGKYNLNTMLCMQVELTGSIRYTYRTDSSRSDAALA